jgi:hypothetical protein
VLDAWEDFDGLAASIGLPELADMSLGRLSSFVWWALVRNCDTQQAVEKIRARLWRPPPTVEPATGPWCAQAQMDGFNALRTALGK